MRKISERKNLKICRIANVPFFFQNHLKSTVESIVEAGHELHLICSPTPNIEKVLKFKSVKIHQIAIERDVSPWKDLKSLWKIFRLFRQERFDIVHSCTPKSGLLVAIAGFLARVPVRMHTFTGQAWLHRDGIIRSISKFCDKMIIQLNTRSYADGNSQVEFLVSEKICRPGQLEVLGDGSLAGVDSEKFNPARWDRADRADIRRKLGISEQAVVINFTGRVNVDKGIRELVEAFKKLLARGIDAFLVIVGPLETNRDKISDELQAFIEFHKRITLVGYTEDPAQYLVISDIFCLPSYREGFGNVIIEAGMMGIPSVCSRVIGIVDSVLDTETGILVEPKNALQLEEALFRMIKDEEMRQRLGSHARARALHSFDFKKVNQLVISQYSSFFSPYSDKEEI